MSSEDYRLERYRETKQNKNNIFQEATEQAASIIAALGSNDEIYNIDTELASKWLGFLRTKITN